MELVRNECIKWVQMISGYSTYIAERERLFLTLDKGRTLSVTLAACERAYSVCVQTQNCAIVQPGQLRKVLDAMWAGNLVSEMVVPDEFDPESLMDDLDMSVYCALEHARAYSASELSSPQLVLELVLDIANAVDGAQSSEPLTGAFAGDVFLMDPFSCSAIEMARQMQDLADAENSADARSLAVLLRKRSTLQCLVQDWFQLDC